MKPIGHAFGRASGLSHHDCHFTAYRFEEERGFAPDQGDSWVMQVAGDARHVVMFKRGWLTSMWRSPSGQLFVTDAARRVYRIPAGPPGRSDYIVHDLPATFGGVWGLDDDLVWAWGIQAGTPVLFRWDGAQWHAEESPGEIIAIHGARRDLCVAVGVGGLVAAWDGLAWRRVTSPSTTTLSSVFVADENEIYASDRRGLFAGSLSSLREVLAPDGGLAGVAKWKGDVWVGAGGSLGLSKLVDGALVSVRPTLPGVVLDVRGDLLVSNSGVLASSSDGVQFTGLRASHFAQMSVNEPPAWR